VAGEPEPDEEHAVAADVAVANAVAAIRTGRRRVLVTMLGVGLIWGALGLAGYATGWQTHRRQATHALLTSQRQARAATHGQPCVVASPATGQLAGTLQIPALHLTAPVEEGTADTQLAVAVGHDATSVWPGQSGTAVFLAHDVSYFVHLGQLQAGDQVVYQTACNTVTYTVTGQQIVTQGAAVADSPSPTMVLDTCYPPNALFFTTQRLLVTATESTGAPSTNAAPAPAGSPALSPQDQVSYTVPAPPDLVAQGLTLDQNEAPMGTMTLAGQTSPTWEQSPGPLALEAAALEAYFGGLDAAADQRPDWWSAIATGPMPAPLPGATVTGHNSPLDVEIDSTNGAVAQVVLRTTVTLAGGAAPGTYTETVTTPVQGSTVRIGTWTLVPA
jgi:sortase A